MALTFEQLVVEACNRSGGKRPYRQEHETTEQYRAMLGRDAPPGPFAADLVTDLSTFSDFARTLTEARFTNMNRDDLEATYRVGLWDDAWDGYFYLRALLISHDLSYDRRVAELPTYRGTLRFFGETRAFRTGDLLFLKKGDHEASHPGNALTIPISALDSGPEDPNLAELLAIFGQALIGDLRQWSGTRREPSARLPANGGQGTSFDVFLSHCSKDAAPAQRLADALGRSGKKVFFSPITLMRLGSTNFMKVIDEALEGSKHFIVFASCVENLRSGWVEAEWRTFINEVRSGRKTGNFLTVLNSQLSFDSLPIAIRQYEVIFADKPYLERVLSYLT